MSFKTDIFDAISASEALAELGIEPVKFSWGIAVGAPAAPYIVAQVISGNGETDFDGARDVSFPLVQFSCWASSAVEAEAIMKVFSVEMEGRNLPGDSNTSLGYAGENSTYDSTTRLYGEIRDYRVSANTN